MQAPDVTPDGSPVAVYLALPASPEFDPVFEALPDNGSVLDLGCGTGRLSNLLAGSGYDVVAVDESPTMLAHVTDSAETVHAAATVTRHERRAGEVRVDFEIIDRDGLTFEARSTYRLGQRAWDQQFRARIVDDGEFARALESSGLRVEGWLTERWATAARA